MLTWRLWHLLRYPLRQNEVFRRIWREAKIQTPSTERQVSIPLRMLLMAIGMGVVLVLIPVVLVLALLSLLTLPLLLLTFNGTMLGVYWVSAITVRLAYHLGHKRAELIGTTPRSILGISWIIATVCVHRGDVLRTAYRLIQSVTGIVGALLAVALFFIATNLADSPLRSSQVNLLVDILGIMGFVLVVWIDHIQSIVLAVLVSILAPTYTTERPLIRISTISFYFTLQMIFYAVMITFLRVSQLTAASLFDSLITQRLIVIAVMLVTFYGIRELLISGLYHLLLKRYEMTNDEFQGMVA
jgi:hypothetical protein